MNIQAAVEAPRFTKYTFSGFDVEMENRFSGKTREELTARGHQIKVLGDFFEPRWRRASRLLRDFATGMNLRHMDSAERWPGRGGITIF